MVFSYKPVEDESSPLIVPENSSDGRSPSPGVHLEEPVVESKSTAYLILLTLCIGGLQIVWSVELSNGSPYLLSLGMSKALLAFVWLAGPLTGVLVQPYVGIKSDQCRISWGKRKPFMIMGTLGTMVSSMLLAYARDIIRVCGGFASDDPYQGAYKVSTIAFATVMMWVLDFAINTVQAAVRAFIVDNAPAHQQESANAWASRIVGIGSVTGYVFGYLNLPQYFWFFGNTQFKVLVVIASIALSITILISITYIKERNPQLDPPSKSSRQKGVFAFFQQVFRSIRRLPPQIRKICEVQFAYWIGWFPFLFYITTYIGQLYVNPDIHPGMTDEEVDHLWAKATRVGTFALLIYAITSFLSNLLFPFFVVPTYKRPLAADSSLKRPLSPESPVGTRTRSPSYSEVAFQNANSAARAEAQVDLLQPRKTGLARLQIPGLTLRRAWFLSQLLFAVCMFSTFFISTPTAAIIMTAIVGIPWSITLWAPFALISGEIAKRDELRRQRQRRKSLVGDTSDEDDEEDKAGVLLGLHNVAISSPQVLATLISSVVFKFLQKPRNVPGDASVGWTLRIGGVAALAAAFITWRMKEADEVDEE